MSSSDESSAAERWDDRTVRLIGDEGAGYLHSARVLVVGVGGVGGYAAEMLARSGVGHLTLIDSDDVALSNVNRQLVALRSTVGRSKVSLYAERFRDINPEIEVRVRKEYLSEETAESILSSEGYDYVLDCIDSVAPKVSLIAACVKHGIPVISSMGAGGRHDCSQVRCMSLWQTRDDGLARVVRQRLRKLGCTADILVVASLEKPESMSLLMEQGRANKRSSYGTLATIPALFGIMMAGEVIDRLLDEIGKNKSVSTSKSALE